MHQIDPMKRERATAVLVDFCHTKLRFRKIKIFWALPWKNLRLLMWPKNPISSYFGQNSEMQNCQDYTDPTVPIGIKKSDFSLGGGGGYQPLPFDNWTYVKSIGQILASY